MSGQDSRPAVAGRFAALLDFFRSETAGGAVLLAASAAAIVWANSPAAPSYFRMLRLPIGVSFGSAGFVWPLQTWVNDGLMAF
ncbi:MAG: Na+/H+ antiporter NhaA, partial [Acetobacteraceae bacterium]